MLFLRSQQNPRSVFLTGECSGACLLAVCFDAIAMGVYELLDREQTKAVNNGKCLGAWVCIWAHFESIGTGVP